MPEIPDTSTPDGSTTTTSDPTSSAGDEFTPITSQEDLNKVIGERVQRERAKFADYKDVKAKASKLDEIEQANKSEIDKAMDRVSQAEAQVATIPSQVADALRSHLVALHEIPADKAELFLTATDPALLLRQVEGLMEQSAASKKNGNQVPREGTNPTQPTDDVREFARSLFGRTT